MSTGVGLRPAQVDTTPGDPVTVVVDLDNHLPDARQFQVRVVGADTDWAGTPQVTSRLEPGARTSLELTVTLPLGFPTGEHLLGVEVVPITPQGGPSTDQHQRRVADLTVSVGSLAGLHAVLEPRNVTGRQRARISSLNPRGLVRSRGSGVRRARGGQATVSLRNRGFEPIGVSITAESPGDELRILLDQTQMVIPPGHVVPVRTKIKARRPWFGRPRRTPFTITAKGTGTAVHLEGSLQRYARIRPGAMKGVGILAVFAVWASTLAFAWEHVVQEETEEVTAEQASDVEDEEPGGPATDGGAPGNDGGSAPGNDGGGSEGNGSGAVRDLSVSAAAVEASGQVTAREPEGVRVRIRSVSLVDEISQDATFQASPRGSTSRGVKLLGRRGGVIHNRIVPEEVATSTDDEGRWAVAGLEGPGFFEVRFSKPGYATRAYVVEIPEDGTPISLDTDLTAGDGGMSGLVVGPDGPMGEVDITVTDGTVTFNTTTPTTGAVGNWSVEGLATPGSYLVTASRRGYGTATQLVRLSGGESLNGLQIPMQEGTGAITGTVRSNSGPLGDITITATDGETERTTTSLTEGPIGTYSLDELPSPGTYTLTIEGDGWLSQTRDVVLDGGQATANIDMIARTGIAYGRIVDTAGEPLGGVGITAISEDHLYKSTTSPDGRFELVGLEPGSYVIEFLSFEHHTGSSLITIGSGGLREVNLSLQPRDTLEPPPNNSLTFSFSDDGDITVTERTTGDTASTGGGSSASFTNLPAGVRTFDVTGVGFQPATVQFRMGLNGPFSTSVTLKPLVVVDFEVRARIGGAPLADAQVTIRRNDPVACPPTNVSPGCEPFQGTTDADGKALDAEDDPPELTDGAWIASIELEGYAVGGVTFTTNFDTSPVTEVDVLVDKLGQLTLNIIEPVLNPDDSVSFEVVDDIEITLVGTADDGTAVSRTWPDQDQNPYVLDAIQPGDYRVELSRPGYRPTTFPAAGEPSLRLDLNDEEEENPVIVPVPAGTFGRVVWDRNGTDEPVQGARVRIDGIASFTPSDIPNVDPDDEPGWWVTTTDANGEFSFEGDEGPIFGEADITVTFPNSAGGYVANAFEPLGPTQIDSNTDLGDLELNPRPGAMLLGAALNFNDPGVLPAEMRADRIRIDIVDGPDGAPIETFEPTVGGAGMTSADFLIQDLPAGNYDVHIYYEPDGGTDENRFTPVDLAVYVPPFNTAQPPIQSLNAQGRISGGVLGITDPNVADVVGSATPLDGATVRLEDAEGNLAQTESPNPQVLDAGDPNLPGDGETAFNFIALDAGTYRLVVTRDGYTEDMLADFYDPIILDVGDRAENVSAPLRKLASISGTILGDDRTDDDPGPLYDASVTLVQNGVEYGPYETGEFGEYSFDDLDEGPFTISIEAEGYNELTCAFPEDPDDLNPAGCPGGDGLDWGEDREDVDLTTVIKGATLTFSIESSDGPAGTPDGLTIALYRDDVLVVDAPVTDPDTGQFVYTDLVPGPYRLELNAPNHRPLIIGEDTPINLQGGQLEPLGTLQLAADLSTINGTVTLRVGWHPANDQSGATVDLVDDEDNVVQTTDTDDAGDYTLDEIEDGTYTVRVSMDGYTGDESDPIPLVDAAEATFDTTIDALTHEITVTVSSEVGDELLDGVPVYLADQTTCDAGTYQAITDADGVATFTDVVPGSYIATACASEVDHLDAGTQIDLDIADDPDTTFEIVIQEALITGWVEIQSSNDASINGVHVDVYGNAQPTSYEFMGHDASTMKAEFELYVAPGTFRVEATGPGAGTYLPDEEDGIDVDAGDTADDFAPEGDPLVVVEAAEVTIEVYENGRPTVSVNGATLTYTGPTQGAATDGGAGDADGQANGEVQLTGLHPGTYSVSVDANANAGYDSGSESGILLDHGHNDDVSIGVDAYGTLQVNITGDGTGSVYHVILTPTGGQPILPPYRLQNSNDPSRQIPNLATGEYHIEVCRTDFNDADECVEGSVHGTDTKTVIRGDVIEVTVDLTTVPEPDDGG